MKTILFMFVAMLTMTFASCGNQSTTKVDTENDTENDTVKVDTMFTDSVNVNDSLVVEDSLSVMADTCDVIE